MAQRRILGALATISVLGVTVMGVAVGRQAFAGRTVSTPTGVLAHGSRSDAKKMGVQFLGSVDPARLPKASATAQANTKVPPYMTFWNKTKYASMKAKAAHSAAPGASANDPVMQTTNMRALGVSSPTSNTPNPTGLIYAQGENSGTPSDMGLASGGGYVVQFVNSSIAVYNTSGTLQSGWPKTANTFYGTTSSHDEFDPRVLYDAVGGHFFALMDDVQGFTGGTQSSAFYVAVSKTSNPTGGWWIYSFTTSQGIGTANSAWADFPMMGMDSEALYLSGNRFFFTANSGNFDNSFVMFASKAMLESGGSVTATMFDNLSTSAGQAFSVHPAFEYGVPRAEIMVDANYCPSTCNNYDIWAISNPLGATPTLSYVTIGNQSYALPPSGNQPNNGSTSGLGTMDTGDTRVGATPIWRDGSLYFAITSAVNNGSGTNVAGILWFNMGIGLDNGNVACGTLPNRCTSLINAYGKENGQLIYSGTTDASYPSIAVDTDGNMLMAYSMSSSSLYGTFAVYGRRATTQRGVLGTAGNFVQTGIGYYLGFPGSNGGYSPPYRWGDYTAISLDTNACPASGCFKMWFSGMYARSDNGWGTVISNASYSITNP